MRPFNYLFLAPLWIILHSNLWQSHTVVDNPTIQDVNQAEEDLEDHQAILEAVKARDANLARQRLTHHFDRLQERISQAVGGD